MLDTGTHEELWERCALYRMLLSGPGDDAEGDRRAARGLAPRRARSTASRPTRGRASTPTSCAASRSRARTAGAERSGARRRRRRRRRRQLDGAAWAARSRRRRSCSRRSTRSRPPTADPHDRRRRSRAEPAPDFKFLRFLQRYRGWLSIGLLLVALDAVVHARRAAARPLRHRPRRRSSSTTEALFAAASSCSSRSRSFDWWVMWAEARVMGRTSERLLHALRVKVFAHLQRLGVDYYEQEMAGRDHDAHDDRHRRAVAAAPERSGQRARQPRDVRRRGRSRSRSWTRSSALITASILPPLIIATIWFRVGVDTRLRDRRVNGSPR